MREFLDSILSPKKNIYAAGRLEHLPGRILRPSGKGCDGVIGHTGHKIVPPTERHKKDRGRDKEKTYEA